MFTRNTPFLLFDESIFQNNLQTMLKKVKQEGVSFRPHMKTVQSRYIAQYLKEQGIISATVSSPGMAIYLKSYFDDVTLAFPFNPKWVKAVNEVSKEAFVHILVDNPDSLKGLNNSFNSEVGVWVEIDAGYHRTGVLSENFQNIDTILDIIKTSSNLKFTGFYCHAGNTYNQGSVEEIRSVFEFSKNELLRLKSDYQTLYPDLIINLGDTPGCSLADNFKGLDSISCGNFMFYDVTQSHLGSCSTSDIAVCLVAPVVGKYPNRGEVVVMGGGVHLSKDYLQWKGKTIYGLVVKRTENGWSEPLENCFVSKISQEHGTLQMDPKFIDTIELGDNLGILPVHSCMTAECMGGYLNIHEKEVDHFASKQYASAR